MVPLQSIFRDRAKALSLGVKDVVIRAVGSTNYHDLKAKRSTIERLFSGETIDPKLSNFLLTVRALGGDVQIVWKEGDQTQQVLENLNAYLDSGTTG